MYPFRFQHQRFTGVRILLTKCQDMIGINPNRKYICISLMSLAVVAMLVTEHFYLTSWHLSLDRWQYSTEKTSPVEQQLEDMLHKRKLEQNLSSVGEVSNEGPRQYNARESLVAEMQYQRQQRVSQICKEKGNNFPMLPLDQYITGWVVDCNHGVAFRATAKAGSSTWLSVMISALYGRPSAPEDIRRLRIYMNSIDQLKSKIKSVDDMKYALQKYKKIVFVRHPLSRLVSTYCAKMGWEIYRERYEDVIIKFSTNKTAIHDKNLTFRDFVRYIIATREKAKDFDVHWKPLALLLQPCQFHYNFIGKLETIEDDSKYIFQNLFGDPSLTLPRKNIGAVRKQHTCTKSIQEYYHELTSQELTDIIDVYTDDFAMFGYDKIVPVR